MSTQSGTYVHTRVQKRRTQTCPTGRDTQLVSSRTIIFIFCIHRGALCTTTGLASTFVWIKTLPIGRSSATADRSTSKSFRLAGTEIPLPPAPLRCPSKAFWPHRELEHPPTACPPGTSEAVAGAARTRRDAWPARWDGGGARRAY